MYFNTGRFPAGRPAGYQKPLPHGEATFGPRQLCSETGKPPRLHGQQTWTPNHPLCRCWHCLFVQKWSRSGSLELVKVSRSQWHKSTNAVILCFATKAELGAHLSSLSCSWAATSRGAGPTLPTASTSQSHPNEQYPINNVKWHQLVAFM